MYIAILRPWHREHSPNYQYLQGNTLEECQKEANEKFIKGIRGFDEKELLDVIPSDEALIHSKEYDEPILKPEISEKYWEKYK